MLVAARIEGMYTYDCMVTQMCVAAEGTPLTQERVHSIAEFHISLILQASDISKAVPISEICLRLRSGVTGLHI